MNPELRRYLKALLTIPNPKYEDAVNFGRWTKGIPKTIRQFEQEGDTIIAPRGILSHILEDLDVSWEVEDCRVSVEADWPESTVLLRPDDQETAVSKLLSCANGFLSAPAGSGKALAVDTVIPTPTGWTTMGDLKINDEVLSRNGEPTKVTWVSSIQHRKNYRLLFDTGQVVVACEDHLWETCTYDERARSFVRKNPRCSAEAQHKEAVPSIRSTKEIVGSLKEKGIRANHSICVAPLLNLPNANLPIPPYTLGAWLGDGSSSSSRIYSADPEVLENVEKDNFRVNKLKAKYAWSVLNPSHKERFSRRRNCKGVFVSDPDCLHYKLRKNNLIRNKHIPEIYKRASAEQRLSLLQGLLDTDGCATKRGGCFFVSVNKRLAEDVLEIVRSLGIKANLIKSKYDSGKKGVCECYRICFTTTLPVFRLTRKKNRLPKKLRSTHKWHYIVAAQEVESVPLRCIQVADESHMFLATESFIPTHNTIMGLELARRLRQRTLFLVHLENLKEQVIEEAIEHFGFDKKSIGVLHGKKWEIGDALTVGMIPTLRLRDLSDIVKLFGTVIIDEAHHAPSTSFLNVINEFHAQNTIGLTATAYRRDKLDPIMFNAIGPKLAEIEHFDLVEDEHLMIPTIIRKNTGWSPPNSHRMEYQDFMEAMVTAENRNKMIVDDIVSECIPGNFCIALVERTAHAQVLSQMLKDKGLRAEFVVASVDKEGGARDDKGRKKKRAIPKKMREKTISDLKEGKLQAVVATYDLLMEGFNFKPLNRLFFASPIRWKGNVIQALGRVQRPAEGKTEALAYDYVDECIGMFVRQADSRSSSVYEPMGMRIVKG